MTTAGQSDPGRALLDAVQADILRDWTGYGAQTLAVLRQERPHEYLKIIAGLLPKDRPAKTEALHELTDEQLAGRLSAVLAQLAEKRDRAGGRDAPPTARQPARFLPAL